ncbi:MULTISPECIES: acyl-ACP--UDP-N-acetylglucosamine O-acyltransferase [Idiomarinaceae]|uniref:Acyl-[acyl-carrier-protein]--UDP-N-acetylglucosamine O-acyltransferase n=2 Tax=Pseudidiomarina TaxID=2800384 RepID=A0A368UZV9_9GAMM|nr:MULTISPECIES: acyl-ACP--UDP-N-acetylglucosamine O-acyltransferase [Idiomarinaceae]NCU56967.1 acyl-ACP--UDP-N-acetylglucosamine O-acyltransferase [Idiomarina sp. FenA--70]NCU59676.1 acyl-ACP--UDP-N-acetylglucosamine O-acyltransferase [Idiomarina sp. FenBw--71]MRJ41492.1 acyl-ACP--UDP-N-acetylglucosamine O-acyltransferase [Idiomarina sp. FeN1]PWW14323.1 acyl-[acyl-carrier-protein]--UDP-N-acetylglucosamine O-acyltransferase [Pseudidiomarina maritima]RBP92677.1 acyl-[acyl-carrier-protein]--UDP-
MIHSTAIVDKSAKLGANVEIGPYSIIGADVEIGDGTVIGPHVVVKGPTTLGKNNRIFQFSSVGEDCQDKKYAGEPTRLVIGDNNIIRECVTIHRGTVQDQGLTQIGDDNLLMAYVHVAHDCMVGDHVILANNTSLAGHVHVGDWAILGGFTGVHQFCHIGAHAFTAVNSVVVQDVPPYVMAQGHNAVPRTINSEGLKRRGFTSEQILNIKRAFKLLYRQGLTVTEAVSQMQELNAAELGPLIEFVQQSRRGIIR